MKHKSVFKNEAVEFLNLKENKIYLDLTLGSGGHSLEILNKLESIRLFAFDLDQRNIDSFVNILRDKGFDESRAGSVHRAKMDKKEVVLINDNFTKLGEYLRKAGVDKVDGILADLGWSSDQLDSIPGLSYENLYDELDMRLSTALGVKASDLLNALSRKELSEMFARYSDIKGNQNEKLVSAIVSFRKKNLFEKVDDLVNVVDQASRGSQFRRFGNENKNSNYSKVFQALRIAVNNEMQNLEEMLNEGYRVLAKNGRFAVITFHSGEERVVNGFFKNLIAKKEAQFVSNQYGEVYTRPSVEELTENLRSRSAKLWVIEKL